MVMAMIRFEMSMFGNALFLYMDVVKGLCCVTVARVGMCLFEMLCFVYGFG